MDGLNLDTGEHLKLQECRGEDVDPAWDDELAIVEETRVMRKDKAVTQIMETISLLRSSEPATVIEACRVLVFIYLCCILVTSQCELFQANPGEGYLLISTGPILSALIAHSVPAC